MMQSSVSKALGNKEVVLEDCVIQVHGTEKERDPQTVFVRGFPPGTTESDLKALFSPYGSIKQVRLPASSTADAGLTRPHARRFCYVEFESPVSFMR